MAAEGTRLGAVVPLSTGSQAFALVPAVRRGSADTRVVHGPVSSGGRCPDRAPAGVPRCSGLVVGRSASRGARPWVRRLASSGARPGGERRHRRGALWWRAGGRCPRVADARIVRRLASSGARPGSCVGRRPPVPGLGRASVGVLRCPGLVVCRLASPVPGPRASDGIAGRSVVAGRGRCPGVADARIVCRLVSSGARLPDRASGGGPAGCSVVAGRGPVPSGGRCPDRASADVLRCPAPGSCPGRRHCRAFTGGGPGGPGWPMPASWAVPASGPCRAGTASPPGVHPWWAISPRPWWWRRSTGVRCTAMRAASSPSRPPTWASRSRRRWCISASGLSSVHRATRSASG